MQQHFARGGGGVLKMYQAKSAENQIWLEVGWGEIQKSKFVRIS